MMMLPRLSVAVVAVSVALGGCAKDGAVSKSAADNAAPPVAPPASGAAVAAAKSNDVQGQANARQRQGGVVLETMDAAGYTYAKLDAAGGPIWVAGPQTPIKTGQKIDFDGGQLMTNFHSKTLDRTFSEIYFISSFGGGAPAGHGDAQAGHGDAQAGHGGAQAGHGGAPAVAPGDVGTIEPALGGIKVADLFAQRATLAGKPVTVRGKVVKYNAGIMGRNWLHLQDGSGAAADGTHDITVTTSGTTAAGEVITVKGTVVLDKDFGAGYSYSVLIEDAVIGAQ